MDKIPDRMALYSWLHLETVDQRQKLPDVGRLDRPPRGHHDQPLFRKTKSDMTGPLLAMSDAILPSNDLQVLDPPIPRVATHPSKDFRRVPQQFYGTACGTIIKS